MSRACLFTASLPFAFAALALGDAPAPRPRGEVKLTEEAQKLHAEALVIDGHNDLPWRLREEEAGPLKRVIDLRRPQKFLHTDLDRLKKGGVGAQFWSAWVPADTGKKGTAVTMTIEQIDVIRRMVEKYPEAFEMAYTAYDVLRIRKAGKIASLIGIEGGHSIDNSLGVLRIYYRLGARYMTLTHSENLDWADSSTDEPKLKGLSPFGEQVVAEMNRLGMMVDISHVSADTMRHVLRVTKAPIIASHSSAYAVAQHDRNVPDDVLKLVAKNRGVVMVNFFSGFVVPEGARAMKDMFAAWRQLKEEYKGKPESDFKEAWKQWKQQHRFPAGTIHHVVDHIDHIVKVAGIDCVGLGSDYDGISTVPRQLEDVSTYPYITQELLNRGYTREQILRVLGGNLMRVFREVEQAAAKK